VLRNKKERYDGEVVEGDTDAFMQIRKNISARVVQSDATSFFHIPSEAKVGGPVQYRWMHRTEILRSLVGNKVRV
jgi:hypothetical protein